MSLSKTSEERLSTCHESIQEFVRHVSKKYPLMVVCGHRGEKEQNEAYEKGQSKLKFPSSKHNVFPSLAVDLAPLKDGKIDWNDGSQWYHFAGYVQGVAETLGIKVRWGGDWNMNFNLKDQTFFDLPHFELVLD